MPITASVQQCWIFSDFVRQPFVEESATLFFRLLLWACLFLVTGLWTLYVCRRSLIIRFKNNKGLLGHSPLLNASFNGNLALGMSVFRKHVCLDIHFSVRIQFVWVFFFFFCAPSPPLPDYFFFLFSSYLFSWFWFGWNTSELASFLAWFNYFETDKDWSFDRGWLCSSHRTLLQGGLSVDRSVQI